MVYNVETNCFKEVKRFHFQMKPYLMLKTLALTFALVQRGMNNFSLMFLKHIFIASNVDLLTTFQDI